MNIYMFMTIWVSVVDVNEIDVNDSEVDLFSPVLRTEFEPCLLPAKNGQVVRIILCMYNISSYMEL